MELDKAKQQLAGRAFIKGNIDPVNTLLMGTPESIAEDVRWRIEVGKPGGGYILSSACSVAPRTPPEHLKMLADLAETYGRYA
ncbi:MAG: uroporphyrinogen decarboxylase family protein [candidate division KSB1 bacterium]|nr:uroporphyrinogen decarboxylase family protein [candidate division KSB1 bacterium]